MADGGWKAVTFSRSKEFLLSGFQNPKSLPPLAVRRSHLTQKLKFIETFAGPFSDRAERIFRYMDRQTCLFAQKLVEAAQ